MGVANLVVTCFAMDANSDIWEFKFLWIFDSMRV
jgi:hypothetical protein